MLPAPIIQGTLPAFYLDDDGMAKITIPFSMSRAVNQNEVKRFKLKIKNIQGYDYLATLDSSSFSFIDSEVTFEINKQALEEAFLAGSFYKAQLAYVKVGDEEEVGYYSTVGIIKYTTKPNVEILNLSSSKNNSHSYHYTGTYSQYEKDEVTGSNKKDATEKVYSYRFIIKNDNNVIIEDTGYLVHNNSNDEKYYESQDTFTYTHDLELNRKYTITYMVKTNNGLEISSFPYKIMEKESLPSDLIQSITPFLNYENGYIKIKLQGALDDQGLEIPAKGSFVLTRASEDSNYMDWETISEFNLFAQRPSTLEWKDFTIEQGKNYKYAIQQYNKANSLYSKRLISATIFADFEDSFLFDGKRQLKIKFNPKVQSFKKTNLEAKLDTLGSKYPFIFRNGRVEYREFPISGLISYLADEESLFMDTKEQFYNEERIEKDIYKKYFSDTNKNISSNGVANKKLAEMAYKKDYLFFYYFDSKIKVYRRWVDFLERPNITLQEYEKNPTVPLTKDYSNFKYFETYFDATNSATYADKLFLRSKEAANKLDVSNYRFKTTNEVSYNLQLERDFKMEVLAWLTNGEPKLFKSPAEGNYIVRLMNTSLSPNDQLGRMLHTFNSTAYEIADLTYEALVQYGFVNNQQSINTYFKVMSIPLSTTDVNYVGLMANKVQYVLDNGVYYATGPLLAINTATELVQLTDMDPGTEIQINGASFLIGQTGEFNSSAPIQQIILPARELGQLTEQEYNLYNHTIYFQNESTKKLMASEDWNSTNVYYDIQRSSGILTVAYYEEIDNSFSNVIGSEIQEVYGRQFIGEHENVLDILNNAESKILSYYQVRNYLRPIIPIGTAQYYFDNKAKFSELNLYEYEQLFDDILNVGLYRRVRFEPTDFYDTDFYEESRLNRSLEYRVSSNHNLKNTRDYDAYRNNNALYIYNGTDFVLVEKESEYDSATPYFIQESIHYLIDPQNEEKVYLTKESYDLFVDMWREMRTLNGVNKMPIEDVFAANFNKYSTYLWINSENIDLEKIEYYEVRDMEKFNSYELSVGVYSEFFYRVQIVNYDLSNDYSLQQLQTTVRNLEYQLGRDYMMEQKDDEEKYLDTLRSVRQTYPALYAQYIMRLTEYLEALEKEV